jgi:hypothetical protein
LTTPEVIEREFGNLSAISDHRPKYVVTMDPVLHSMVDGIHHIQARDWEEVVR